MDIFPFWNQLALRIYWQQLILLNKIYNQFDPLQAHEIVGPLIYFFAREAKGHGVPEVMAAVALRGGVIRRRIVAIKALASAISIGSGGSVAFFVLIHSRIVSQATAILGDPSAQYDYWNHF